MRKKIYNVFAKEDYHCFACSPHNNTGLKLIFFETETGVETEWTPKQQFEGYPGVIHGGILSVLLDEVSSWTLYIKGKTSGVTSRLNVKFRKPALSTQKKFIIKGELEKIEKNFAYIKSQIYNDTNALLAEASAIFYAFPVQEAIAKKWFPENYDDFFKETV